MMQFRQVQSSTNQKEYRKIYSVKADMRSKDFVSVFLLQQLLVTASRSGKEKEMNRKDVKKLLLAVIAVVIVAKIATAYDVGQTKAAEVCEKQKHTCNRWFRFRQDQIFCKAEPHADAQFLRCD